MPPEPIRLSRDSEEPRDSGPLHPIAITRALDDRVRLLEEQFRDLDGELRRRFGDDSYSVDRSEQVLGAVQRLRWAILRSPVVHPFPAPQNSEDLPDSR